MPQTKATKKFEKRHLKDTLERRKGLKKIKQKQQLKAKKKARRAEEDGRSVDQTEKSNGLQDGDSAGKKNAKDAFQDMSVDEFFQSGFEIPDLPKQHTRKKRKREEEDEEADSDVSFEEEPVPQAGSDMDEESEEENFEAHMQQLDALAENDPEFHKYLQENEPELLDANVDEKEDESGDDDIEEPKAKRVKKALANTGDEFMDGDEGGLPGQNELTKAMVEKWRTALTTQHSLRAAKEVVMAFRSAAHASDGEEQEFKYSISDPQVYHELLTVALKHIPTVFEHHLPVQESKNGKVHVPTEGKKFKTLAPILRSQIGSIIHLLDNLSDPSTQRLTLSSTSPLLPYLLSFKKLVRSLAGAVTEIWSSHSNTEATRISAFLVLRRLTVIGDPGIRENILKMVYQGLVKSSRHTTIHSIGGVNLMKNSASELWGLVDHSVAYTTAFTFIRQLAIHLRSSIQNNAKESYKNVYNWQYVHSLDFWSRVFSSHAMESTSHLRPLIYPLVQVTLGAMRLIPTATYFPLRFQLIRSLLRLSRTTNTYIPLSAPLYEVLSSAEMRRAPKASTLKPFDFSTNIRAPKGYLRTRAYQDGVGEQVVELLGEFFVLWCKSVAFPELALAPTVVIKRWLKDANNRVPGKGNKNQKINGLVALLVQKLEANARFVEEKRAKVDFAPNNRKGVEDFLQDVNWEKLPLGAFVVGQRKAREERERVVAEGRKQVEEGGKKGASVDDDVEMVDVDGGTDNESE